MTKIYSTLGRRFNKKDLEDAQRMGMDLGVGAEVRLGRVPQSACSCVQYYFYLLMMLLQTACGKLLK